MRTYEYMINEKTELFRDSRTNAFLAASREQQKITLYDSGIIIFARYPYQFYCESRARLFSHTNRFTDRMLFALLHLFCQSSIKTFRLELKIDFKIYQIFSTKLYVFTILFWEMRIINVKGNKNFTTYLLALVIANLCQLKRSFNINKTASPQPSACFYGRLDGDLFE